MDGDDGNGDDYDPCGVVVLAGEDDYDDDDDDMMLFSLQVMTPEGFFRAGGDFARATVNRRHSVIVD